MKLGIRKSLLEISQSKAFIEDYKEQLNAPVLTKEEIARKNESEEHGELNDWTVDDVVEWIETLEQGRFSKHAKAFKKSKIDGKKLQLLKTDRSISMKVKIKDAKARQKIRMHIENLLKRMQRRTKMGGEKEESKKKKRKSSVKKGKGKKKPPAQRGSKVGRSSILSTTHSVQSMDSAISRSSRLSAGVGIVRLSVSSALRRSVRQSTSPRLSAGFQRSSQSSHISRESQLKTQVVVPTRQASLQRLSTLQNMAPRPAAAVNTNHPLQRLQSNLATTFANLNFNTTPTIHLLPPGQDDSDDASTIKTDFSDDTPIQYSGGLLNEPLSIVFNFLRNADAITGNTHSGLSTGIPQIVVVGRKGGGKTSVTQAITGLPLPVCPYSSTEITIPPTRCPLHIIKRKTAHANHFYCAVKICWLWDERQTPTRLGSPMLEQISQITDITQLFQELIRDIITAQERIMTHSSNSTCSRNEVLVEMESSDIDDINLIEIPGFDHDPQSPVNAQITEIMSEYVANKNCVILSVIPTTEDIRMEPMYDLMTTMDPQQTKTIGVLTKLDSIQHEHHGQWVNILTGRMRPLQNGYVAVRNLSDQERQSGLSLQDALQLEYKLFHTNPDWNMKNAEQLLGNSALLQAIRKVLSEKMWQDLPQLKKTIDRKLVESETQLKTFPPIIELQHSKDVVQHLIARLHKEFEIQIRESHEPTIFSYLQKAFQYFMIQISKTRPHFVLDDTDTKNFAVCFTVEDAMHILDWAKQEEAKGEGMFVHRAREVFMTQISTHWVNPAMKCIEHSAQAIIQGIDHVCEKILGPFCGFKDIAKEQCQMLLEQLTQLAIKQVNALIDTERHPYGTADPVRLQRRADAYLAKLQKRDTGKVWLSNPELTQIATSIEGYFDIALLRFGDNVPIAIDSVMCKQFIANLVPVLEEAVTINVSTNEDLHPLVLPEQHMFEMAEGCKHIIENLNHALKQINHVRPDIKVRLGDFDDPNPINALKFGDGPLPQLLDETLIRDLERERVVLRSQLGIGEVDFYDIKVLREQLKGEQKQLMSERRTIEAEKNRIEEDHVIRGREHKRLEDDIREMKELIESERSKIQDQFGTIEQVRDELDDERSEFDKERARMKQKVEEARAALVAANEQLVAEQKKMLLEKENLVHQWKHFEDQKQHGILGKEAGTSHSDEAVELERELLMQDKENLEKEWTLLAVMKAQMEETKEQLTNDTTSCDLIRSELKEARDRFKRDAQELSSHADSIAEQKRKQMEEKQKLEMVKEEIEKINKEVDEKQAQVHREAKLLNDLETQIMNIVGVHASDPEQTSIQEADFKRVVQNSLKEIGEREQALDKEKSSLMQLRVDIEHERGTIEEMKNLLASQTAEMEQVNDQQNSVLEKEELERLKDEMQSELHRMEEERHEIAKAKMELRQLQTEVATQALDSSLKNLHEQSSSIGALNFSEDAIDDTDDDVSMEDLYQKNVTLSSMLKNARKARADLVTQSKAKTNHVQKQKNNRRPTSPDQPTHKKQPSFNMTGEQLVSQRTLPTIHERENSLSGVKVDLSTLITQMQSALDTLESNPEVLNTPPKPLEPTPEERQRRELEAERNSFRQTLKRLSERPSVASNTSAPTEKFTVPKLTIPSYPRSSEDEDEDLGLDSLLTHLEGELDNLTSKKANPFDLISPKYKPNQNLGQLRERTMSTIFRTEDLLPMSDSLIQVEEHGFQTDEQQGVGDARAEEVLQKMIDNITQMQQAETDVLQAMEAFERHHQTKASLGGWDDYA